MNLITLTCILSLIGLTLGQASSQVYNHQGQRRICHGSQIHGYSNICVDPLSNQPRTSAPNPGSITRGFVENLLSITQSIAMNISTERGAFENTHLPCLEHRTSIQRLNLSDVVNIQYCYPTANTKSITNMYVRLAETVKIFEIVKNLDTERCCMFSPTSNRYTRATYSKLQNQLFAHWYILYIHRGISLEGTSCLMKTTRVNHHHLNCDNMRNLVYVILRHAENTLLDSTDFLNALKMRSSFLGRIRNSF